MTTGQPSSQIILDVKDLKVSYGAIQAIKGISFQIFKGEIVTLIGANGAGKTTTLRSLSGLLPCTGEIHFLGKDLQQIPGHQRVPMGLAQSPEGRGVFPQMTVLENLWIGAFHQKDRSISEKILLRVFELFPKLKERQSQLSGTLSGGEQQMLAMGRALMAEPKLLMLDEPSLGLAPKIVSLIFEIIAEINKQGVTVLLVEQNARMALRAAHRAYAVETGLIKLSGTGQELLHNEEVKKCYLGW